MICDVIFHPIYAPVFVASLQVVAVSSRGPLSSIMLSSALEHSRHASKQTISIRPALRHHHFQAMLKSICLGNNVFRLFRRLFAALVNKPVSLCAWLLSDALEILRLRLREWPQTGRFSCQPSLTRLFLQTPYKNYERFIKTIGLTIGLFEV